MPRGKKKKEQDKPVDCATFGEWFGLKLEQQNLTQTAVHRVLRDAGIEVSRASINRWLHNKTVPNKKQMSELLRALQISDRDERARACAAYLGVDLSCEE